MPYEPFGDISDQAIDHLRLFWEGKGIEYHPHHIIDLVVLEGEGAQVSLVYLSYLFVVHPEVLPYFGLLQQGESYWDLGV